jgi:hypothetical protein
MGDPVLLRWSGAKASAGCTTGPRCTSTRRFTVRVLGRANIGAGGRDVPRAHLRKEFHDYWI